MLCLAVSMHAACLCVCVHLCRRIFTEIYMSEPNTTEFLRLKYLELQKNGSKSVAAAVSESLKIQQNTNMPVCVKNISKNSKLIADRLKDPPNIFQVPCVNDTGDFCSFLSDLAQVQSTVPVSQVASKRVGFGSTQSRFGSKSFPSNASSLGA